MDETYTLALSKEDWQLIVDALWCYDEANDNEADRIKCIRLRNAISGTWSWINDT